MSEKKIIPNTLVATTFRISQSHCNISDKCFCTVSIRCVIYPHQAITHLMLLAFRKYLPSLSLAELNCSYSLNAKSEKVKVSGLRGFQLKVSLYYYWGNNQCFKGWSGIASYVPENWQQNARIKGTLGVWTQPLHPSILFSPESNLRHGQSHSGVLPLEQWSSLCPPRGLQPRRETR
jgi:hypothetical protein